MNVVLCRVLYAHALVAAPRLSLGWLHSLAPMLGDPRLGMTSIFLQLSRVLPDEYPLSEDISVYVSNELTSVGCWTSGSSRRDCNSSTSGQRTRSNCHSSWTASVTAT